MEPTTSDTINEVPKVLAPNIWVSILKEFDVDFQTLKRKAQPVPEYYKALIPRKILQGIPYFKSLLDRWMRDGCESNKLIINQDFGFGNFLWDKCQEFIFPDLERIKEHTAKKTRFTVGRLITLASWYNFLTDERGPGILRPFVLNLTSDVMNGLEKRMNYNTFFNVLKLAEYVEVPIHEYIKGFDPANHFNLFSVPIAEKIQNFEDHMEDISLHIQAANLLATYCHQSQKWEQYFNCLIPFSSLPPIAMEHDIKPEIISPFYTPIKGWDHNSNPVKVIKNLCESLLPFQIDGVQTVVAGGSILNAVCGLSLETTDIDIWYLQSEGSTNTQKAEDNERFIEYLYKVVEHLESKFGKVIVSCVSDYIFTLYCQGTSTQIQILYSEYQYPAQVIDAFDIDCCQCLFDGSDIYLSPKAWKSISHKTVFDISSRKINEYRVVKMVKKGFHIQENFAEFIVTDWDYIKKLLEQRPFYFTTPDESVETIRNNVENYLLLRGINGTTFDIKELKQMLLEVSYLGMDRSSIPHLGRKFTYESGSKVVKKENTPQRYVYWNDTNYTDQDLPKLTVKSEAWVSGCQLGVNLEPKLKILSEKVFIKQVFDNRKTYNDATVANSILFNVTKSDNGTELHRKLTALETDLKFKSQFIMDTLKKQSKTRNSTILNHDFQHTFRGFFKDMGNFGDTICLKVISGTTIRIHPSILTELKNKYPDIYVKFESEGENRLMGELLMRLCDITASLQFEYDSIIATSHFIGIPYPILQHINVYSATVMEETNFK